jgi:hypothetical protein
VLSGTNNVTAVQVNVTNSSGSNVTLNNLTVNDLGTGSTSNITSVNVVINGITVGTSTVFSGNSATINLNNYVLPSTTQTLQVVVNYSGSATGTYQMSIGNMTGSSANNGGQPAGFTGLGVSGYNIDCQQPTLTPTSSPTNTSTITPTISPTPTFTQTPVPQNYPVVYPNPADGTSPVAVRPPAYTGNSVHVQIYTLAYRKVFDRSYPYQYGHDPQISLRDSWNNPLASGLYYVVVTTSSGRSIGKMLLLR